MSDQLEESTTAVTGAITGVHDCGSIVVLTMLTDANRLVTAYFDHRCFGWMLQGEQCTAEELIGRVATYDGETIHFVD